MKVFDSNEYRSFETVEELSSVAAHSFSGLDIEFGFASHPILEHGSVAHVKQVHGKNIINLADHNISEFDGLKLEADGLYTRQKQCVLAVKTADCVPILLATEDSGIVMAIHAGWKGLVQNIHLLALEKILEICHKHLLKKT